MEIKTTIRNLLGTAMYKNVSEQQILGFALYSHLANQPLLVNYHDDISPIADCAKGLAQLGTTNSCLTYDLVQDSGSEIEQKIVSLQKWEDNGITDKMPANQTENQQSCLDCIMVAPVNTMNKTDLMAMEKYLECQHQNWTTEQSGKVYHDALLLVGFSTTAHYSPNYFIRFPLWWDWPSLVANFKKNMVNSSENYQGLINRPCMIRPLMYCQRLSHNVTYEGINESRKVTVPFAIKSFIKKGMSESDIEADGKEMTAYGTELLQISAIANDRLTVDYGDLLVLLCGNWNDMTINNCWQDLFGRLMKHRNFYNAMQRETRNDLQKTIETLREIGAKLNTMQLSQGGENEGWMKATDNDHRTYYIKIAEGVKLANQKTDNIAQISVKLYLHNATSNRYSFNHALSLYDLYARYNLTFSSSSNVQTDETLDELRKKMDCAEAKLNLLRKLTDKHFERFSNVFMSNLANEYNSQICGPLISSIRFELPKAIELLKKIIALMDGKKPISFIGSIDLVR